MFNIFVIPLLYIISILPFWCLRGISNFFYLIVYHILGYRKKVVVQNLKNSFPEKSEDEIKKITKQFYLHFCDVIFETLKLYTVSKENFKKHCWFNQEAMRVLGGYSDKGQSIIMILGHVGNWEWDATIHILTFKQLLTGVYHPLSNKRFDKFVYKLRNRFGGNFVTMNNSLKEFLALKQKNIPTSIGLIADQTPPPEGAYWTTFLNQDTPVFNGPEKIAKKFNYPVVYIGVKKVKRSYYELSATVVSENPKDLEPGQIAELYTKALEENIKAQPHIWLWSHRRWKHKKPSKS